MVSSGATCSCPRRAGVWCVAVSVLVVMAATPAWAADAVSSVSETFAVMRVPRTITFAGTGVSAGDKVFWMNDRPDCDVKPSNDGGELVLDEVLSVEATFSQTSSAGVPFTLCYKFGSTPYKMYTSFTLEVKVGVHAFAAGATRTGGAHWRLHGSRASPASTPRRLWWEQSAQT